MTRVLITGATGNVGLAVIKSLQSVYAESENVPAMSITAGVRDVALDKQKLGVFDVECIKFDFTDTTTYESALKNSHILFLLRPPQIADTEKYFKPLIETAKRVKIRHIVFLSVQGVEKSSWIPHHKIEALIKESKIPYTFLRPAYFMQNFTTTLHSDLKQKHLIFLPAHKTKFTLVDVRDIGDVAVKILKHPENHVGAAYELTSNEKLNFVEIAQKLSDGLGLKIQYQSPNLLQFYLQKRKENVPAGYILVLIMLHYLPRFQKEPALTQWIERITGKEPKTFEQFVSDNKNELI